MCPQLVPLRAGREGRGGEGRGGEGRAGRGGEGAARYNTIPSLQSGLRPHTCMEGSSSSYPAEGGRQRTFQHILTVDRASAEHQTSDLTSAPSAPLPLPSLALTGQRREAVSESDVVDTTSLSWEWANLHLTAYHSTK